MGVSFLLGICCAVGSTLVDRADRDTMGWAEVPALNASLGAVASSPLAPTLPLLLPDQERLLLQRAEQCELLLTIDRPPTFGPLALSFGVASTRAMTPILDLFRVWLRQSGYYLVGENAAGALRQERFGRPGGQITLWSAPGRCGVSTHFPLRGDPSRPPLSQNSTYRQLARRAPQADLRARLDVTRLYGWLAHTRGGPRLAGRARRLGIDAVSAIEVDGRVTGAGTIRLNVLVALPKAPEGWFGFLGAPKTSVGVTSTSGFGRGFVALVVRPALLFRSLQKLLSFEAPVEATLLEAQLGAIEAERGGRLAEDALGGESQVWTVFFESGKAGPETTLVARVRDGAAAEKMLSDLAGSLPQVIPRLRVESRPAGAARMLVLGVRRGRDLVVLGWGARAVVVGSTVAAVRRHLGDGPVTADGPAAGAGPALGQGRLDGRWVASLLAGFGTDGSMGAGWSMFWQQLAAGRRNGQRRQAILGTVDWRLTERPTGVMLTIDLHGS